MLKTLPALRILRQSVAKYILFVICACLGAMAGVVFSVQTDYKYILMMRTAADCRVSIVGSVITVLPFIVSCYLVIHSKLWLVYFIPAISLYMYTSALWAIRAAFGSASWLISLLMQAQSLVFIPGLLYLAIKRLACQARSSWFKYVVFAGIVCGMIDYFILSPFLAELMDSYETMGRYAVHVGLNWCI